MDNLRVLKSFLVAKPTQNELNDNTKNHTNSITALKNFGKVSQPNCRSDRDGGWTIFNKEIIRRSQRSTLICSPKQNKRN